MHAVGLFRLSCTYPPGDQLCRDIAAVQADQAGDAGLDSRQPFAVTRDAGGYAGRRVAAVDEALPHEVARLRGLDGGLLLHGLRGKIAGEFGHVVIVRIGEQIIHRRITALPVAKILQLVEQISGRFAGDAREIEILRALAMSAVAGGAALRARLQGIGGARRFTRQRGCAYHDAHHQRPRAIPRLTTVHAHNGPSACRFRPSTSGALRCASQRWRRSFEFRRRMP